MANEVGIVNGKPVAAVQCLDCRKIVGMPICETCNLIVSDCKHKADAPRTPECKP